MTSPTAGNMHGGWHDRTTVSPDYETAALLLLLQQDMLAYLDTEAANSPVVIGAGIPPNWISQSFSVPLSCFPVARSRGNGMGTPCMSRSRVRTERSSSARPFPWHDTDHHTSRYPGNVVSSDSPSPGYHVSRMSSSAYHFGRGRRSPVTVEQLIQHRQHQQDQGGRGQHASHDHPRKRLPIARRSPSRNGRGQQADAAAREVMSTGRIRTSALFMIAFADVTSFAQQILHPTDENQRPARRRRTAK